MFFKHFDFARKNVHFRDYVECKKMKHKNHI